MDPDILRQFYNSKKNSFNDHYNLDIDGIPIELYIEDIKDGNATNGRYSISKNEWVMFPKPITYDIPDISNELQTRLNQCQEVIAGDDPQAIIDLVNDIYMDRKIGLAEDGEASVGNLVFKELRTQDMIGKLKDRYYELRSAELNENKEETDEFTESEEPSTLEDDFINQLAVTGMSMEQARKTYKAILNIFKNKEKSLLKTESDTSDWDNNFVINILTPNKVYWKRKADGKEIVTSYGVFKEPTDVTEWKSEDELKDYILEESEKKEESSLSRLYQHTKGKDTFAVIGSYDIVTNKDRFNELKSYVSKLREKVPNIGFNYLEGTYTYEDGDQGIENSLIIYNIPKQDALDIAKELNQESIIWKDSNYFGFLDQNGNELDTFKNDTKNMTFDDKITNMFGSRLRSGNTYKPAFAFECKLIETDATSSTFSKQHNRCVKEYPICKINLENE